MRPRALLLMSGLSLASLLLLDNATVWARAGSGGSRGSRSYSSPATPSSPSSPSPVTTPPPSSSQQPMQRPGMFGGLMGGIAGFALGGLLGSMLFGGMGGGFGGGVGLLELLLVGCAICFLFRGGRGRPAGVRASAGAVRSAPRRAADQPDRTGPDQPGPDDRGLAGERPGLGYGVLLRLDGRLHGRRCNRRGGGGIGDAGGHRGVLDLHASGRPEALAAVGDPDCVIAREVRVEARLEVARRDRGGLRPAAGRGGDRAPPARRPPPPPGADRRQRRAGDRATGEVRVAVRRAVPAAGRRAA